ATLRLADMRDLAPAVARCRRLLDLDADPVAVADMRSSQHHPGRHLRLRLPSMVGGNGYHRCPGGR
ncbi:AlkA N-terminal domain-containing protein, partial [Micromonospora chalcea]|uniref:AlkA N-terminal domain-containing protein n=1 Tax=Micromonospora chalcea TaxID=1874 RepID=UPI003408CE92